MVALAFSFSLSHRGGSKRRLRVYLGNKKDNVTVIYTPWSNLHKNAGMATGQVGFHDQKKVFLSPFSPFISFSLLLPFLPSISSPPCPLQVLKILIPTRHNAIINRLTKTRTITSTDSLAPDKEAHLKQLRAKAHAVKQAERKEEERVRKEQREEKWRREHAYEELHKGLGEDDGGDADEGTRGRSNQEEWDEDDFM